VVVALASATLILYRLVGTILGAGIGGNAVSELSTPLGAAVTAALALVYHGLLLRADQARRPIAAQVVKGDLSAEPGSAAVPAVDHASERRRLELVGSSGADLDAALAAARAALPDGVSLEDAST
jgi:hypothetical protein